MSLISRLHAPILDVRNPIVRFKSKKAAEEWWKAYRRHVRRGKALTAKPAARRTATGWILQDDMDLFLTVLGFVDDEYLFLVKGEPVLAPDGTLIEWDSLA